MHIHVSMNDADGKNLFASDDPEGTPMLRHAIGGMIATVGDCFALFAPHANSYRRFKANSYAPVAPTWGVNNRTVSFRIPAGPPQAAMSNTAPAGPMPIRISQWQASWRESITASSTRSIPVPQSSAMVMTATDQATTSRRRTGLRRSTAFTARS